MVVHRNDNYAAFLEARIRSFAIYGQRGAPAVTAVSILRQLPPLFRYADVGKFTGNANVFLTRAQAKGLVERVARGVYINRLREAKPGIEEVATFLRTPSYISCEWALNRHGVFCNRR
jgi:hypothetical protein